MYSTNIYYNLPIMGLISEIDVPREYINNETAELKSKAFVVSYIATLKTPKCGLFFANKDQVTANNEHC